MNIIKSKFDKYLPLLVFFCGMLPVLYSIGVMGILEPTEGVIASVARQMVDTNDLSTPILNGYKIFDQPPGVYWITAFGIRLFGNTEFAVRFFLSISAGITALCIFYIGKLFFGTSVAGLSCLLLTTSLLFQTSFRFLSATAFSTAFESLVCLSFFYYLSKPNVSLRLAFWLVFSFAFSFSGFGVFLPLIGITLTAILTEQKRPVKKLFTFVPGLVSFLLFGLGWYIIQILINPGLLKYLIFTLPYNNICVNYQGVPFIVYLVLPFLAIFPWTTIWLHELKKRIGDYKEDPAVAYLLSWALVPFLARLFMVSREWTEIMSSLPPLVLLTAPALKEIYLHKDDNSDETRMIVKSRRAHNLMLVILVFILGLAMVTWKVCTINLFIIESEKILPKTIFFSGIFWLFSASIMILFMVKRLNKSVLVPAAVLIPSLISFTAPVIKGQEPYIKDVYLPSKVELLQTISRLDKYDFICCGKDLSSWYFYTGKNHKILLPQQEMLFATDEGRELTISTKEDIEKKIYEESIFVMPESSQSQISEILGRNLSIKRSDRGWIAATLERK